MRFKTIPNFNRYGISQNGEVWSYIKNTIMKPKIDRYGYLVIGIRNNAGIRKYLTIHRLVAITYLPNNDKTLQVNHIDGNKLNNHVSNLEWVSAKDNIRHSYRKDLNKNHFYATLTNLETGEIRKYVSLKSLGKDIGVLAPVLIGLVKYSEINPILNKYVIKFQNFDEYIRSNTKNFGKKVYCYDYVEQTIKEFESYNLAKYEFGLRTSIDCLNRPSYLHIGYYLSDEPIVKIPKNIFTIEEMLDSRRKFIMEKFRPNARKYMLFDYFNKTYCEVDTLKELHSVINSRGKLISFTHMLSKLSDFAKDDKNLTLNGYGIRPYEKNFKWYNYTIEEILQGYYRTSSRVKYYKGYLENNSEMVFKGPYDIIKKFDLDLKNIPINKITDQVLIQEFQKKTGFRLERLNYPILN